MNNSDKDFAHCSISQEMSNEEINEQLGIGQEEADAYDYEAAKRGKDKEQKSKRLPGAYSSVLVYNRKLSYDFLCIQFLIMFFLPAIMQLTKRRASGP